MYTTKDVIPAASFSKLDCQLLQPKDSLEDWVQCIWVAKSNPETHFHLQEKLYPDAGTSITFVLSPFTPRVFFSNYTCVHVLNCLVDCDQVSVRFKPGAVKKLFNIDVSACQNEDVDLLNTNIAHQIGFNQLLEHLISLPSEQYIPTVLNWLKTKRAGFNQKERRWQHFMNHVSESLIPITPLAEQHGLGRKTVERFFKSDIGMSPSQFFTCIQLRKARLELMSTTKPLADIALTCGYYDQSHLSNVFKDLTRETPNQYRKRKMSHISN
ncbi:Transcriptional regulator, AraC family [Pseudoalteromonas luteoviolacea B = ATCC 29581]|nr:Transcriptional regulator, AraC family [Pseudoalteromonas luteoviolacea B = ATCC 29581]